MNTEIETTRTRQEVAAKEMGIIDTELDLIRFAAEETKDSALKVAMRLGALQARFEPLIYRNQSGHS